MKKTKVVSLAFFNRPNYKESVGEIDTKINNVILEYEDKNYSVKDIISIQNKDQSIIYTIIFQKDEKSIKKD